MKGVLQSRRLTVKHSQMLEKVNLRAVNEAKLA
jgi:hypothetical protein